MRFPISISWFIFVIGMMIQIQSYGQGDALIVDVHHSTYESQCEDGAIDLTVNGGFQPYDYRWSYDGIYAGNTEDLNQIRGGYNYCVTVTDAMCGTVSSCWQVICCPEITIDANVINATKNSCDNGSIDLSVENNSSSYIYTWTYDNGGTPVTFSNTQDVNQLRAGYRYCVTVTDPMCGSASKCWEIKCCDELPNAKIVHYCGTSNLGQINLDLTNGYNYYVSWYDENGNSISGSDDGIKNLQPGSYTAVFKNQSCEFTLTFEILDYGIEYNIIEVNNPNCYSSSTDGSISISVNSNTPYTISWYNSYNGYPSGNPIGTGSNITGLPEGQYVAVIDGVECTIMVGEIRLICCIKFDENGEPYNIMPFPKLTNVDIKWVSSDGLCDGSIDFSTNIPSFTTKTVRIVKMPENTVILNTNNLCIGTYCITIDNGCDEYEECFEIGSCSSVNINISQSITNTCLGYSFGSISITPLGGEMPYNYSWSNGAKTQIINNLAQGQYCVTVTDSHGCFGTKCFSVGLNELVTTRNGCAITTTCNGISVNQNDIGSYTITNQNDCRYRDRYCNDGLFLNSTYIGTYFQNVGNCRVEEKCYTNNQTYKTHIGQFIKGSVGPLLDASGCFLCHTYSYCQYPTLGNQITNFTSQFNGYITQTDPNPCDKGQGAFSCYIKLYCNGYLVGEGCDEGCDIQACFLKINSPSFGTDGNETSLKIDSIQMLEFLKKSGIIDKNIEFLEVTTNLDITNKALKNENISSLRSKQNFIIKPNPAFNFIEIENKASAENTSIDVTIYNFSGRAIKTLSNLNLENAFYQIPIYDLNPGPYKLVISKMGKIVYQSTIIKI